MSVPAFLEVQEFPSSRMKETVSAAVYSVIVFFLPLALGQGGLPQQFVTGIVVNLFLMLAALNLRGWKILFVVMLPAFAVIDRSLILHNWASLPPQLIFLPFVWAANGLLVFLVKYFYLFRKANKWLVLFAACAAKALFLFLVAALFIALKAVPGSFYTAMGLIQFYTAAIGGFAAVLFQIIYFKVIVR